MPNSFRVYVLRDGDGGPGSYVGKTDNFERHREEHNGEVKGAAATKGKQLNLCHVYTGFKDEEDAGSFEATMVQSGNAVSHWNPRNAIA